MTSAFHAHWADGRMATQPQRKQLKVEGEPIGTALETQVEWASARSAITLTPAPGICEATSHSKNHKFTNCTKHKKSRQGRQIIAQRFNAGLQATAKRQVPPGTAEVNHPSPMRQRGIVHPSNNFFRHSWTSMCHCFGVPGEAVSSIISQRGGVAHNKTVRQKFHFLFRRMTRFGSKARDNPALICDPR